MKKATSWRVLLAAVLAAGWVTRMRHILLVVIFGVSLACPGVALARSLIDNAYAKAYDKDSVAAWPLWDGEESVADYAKRAGIKDVQMELDLGGVVAMKLTLIPAGKYLRGLRGDEIEIIEGIRVLVREADKGWNPGERETKLEAVCR